MLICGERIAVPCDIVENNVPLLISRPVMSKLGMMIDAKNHTVTVDGKVFKMATNMAGHYVIPVHEAAQEHCNVVLHLKHLDECTLK